MIETLSIMDLIFLPDISFYKTSKTEKNLQNLQNLKLFLQKINKNFKNHEIFANLENVLLSKKSKPKNKKNIIYTQM